MSFFHKALTHPKALLLLVSVSLAALIVACAEPPKVSLAQPPTQSGCQIFPADNIWNVPINNLPVDHTYDSFINNTNRGMHPDFGSGTDDNGVMYGIPFVTVPSNQAGVPVKFDYNDESDPGPGGWTNPPTNSTTNYPIPTNVPLNNLIEGGPNSGGDQHVLVIKQGASGVPCKLYETWDSRPQNGGSSWLAGSGAIFDLSSNALRPDTWTSADAAGLPIFPGLVRYSEAHAGTINHALRFTVSCAYGKVWPALHQTSGCNASMPPMGERFRLKASYVIPSNFSTETKAILQALKTYGMMVADNGSNWFISGEPNASWDDGTLVDELNQVQAINFEAVNTSSLKISNNSGQAAVPPTGAPSSLVANAAPPHQINLTWSNNAVNQTGFYIERRAGPTGSFTQIASVGAGVTSYSDMNVPDGATYFYQVRAFNPYGTSAYSGSANAPLAFIAPTGLAVVTASTSQINLSWNDNSTGETGYSIERKIGAGGTFAVVATTGSNANSYQDKSLVDGTDYYYQVRAVNAFGNSAYTNQPHTATLLAPPSGLIAWALPGNQIALQWADNSKSEDGYIIERSPNGSSGWTQVGAMTAANITTNTDNSGLSASTTYYYRVTARKAGLTDSTTSNVASANTTVWQVTVPADDGTGNTANTLSYALANGHATAGQTVYFTTDVSFNAGNNWSPNVTAGVILVGNCTGAGPGVTIDGSNLSSGGLMLSNNTLVGLKLTHSQIKTAGPGNKLSCTVVVR